MLSQPTTPDIMPMMSCPLGQMHSTKEIKFIKKSNPTWPFLWWSLIWPTKCCIHINNILKNTPQSSTLTPYMKLIIDLNALLESMIVWVEDGGPLKYQCQTCGKTMKDKKLIKRHAEVHLDLSHTCIVCQKQFKTRNSLSVHYSQTHKNQVMSPWATTWNWKLL